VIGNPGVPIARALPLAAGFGRKVSSVASKRSSLTSVPTTDVMSDRASSAVSETTAGSPEKQDLRYIRYITCFRCIHYMFLMYFSNANVYVGKILLINVAYIYL
jgi:hypothetical protein